MTNEASLTLSLDDPAACDPKRVGPKAAAVATLRQAGLPVPGGFVIPAGAHAGALSSVGAELHGEAVAQVNVPHYAQ